MKKTHKYTLLFIIFLFPALCLAQIPGLINYNEDNGLNSYYTYTIHQDKKGFVWIGSDNGFFRFDGKEFIQYTKRDGLKNVDILECLPLSNNEIFINSFLNDFAYLKNGKIINADQNKGLQKLQFKNTPIILANKDSLILYAPQNPTNLYIYKNEKVKSIPLYYQKSPEDIIAFGFHSQPNLVFLCRKNKKITVYNIFTRKESLCNLSLSKEDMLVMGEKTR
ncbi:hypothetical protein [Chryseobacterium wanjuense]